MAANQMGVTTGGNTQQWIGTTAERTAFVTTGLGPGSVWWDTTLKAGYVWDGSAWQTV